MNPLQILFKCLAGTGILEAAMLSRAHGIYESELSLDEQETQVCWRRKARVGRAMA